MVANHLLSVWQKAVNYVAIMNQLMTEDNDAFADHVEGDFSVNPNRPAIDRLNDLKGGPSSIFESQTGYTFSDWDEFARRVVPQLISRARSTGIQHNRSCRPPKLTPEQRLLSCVMYLKKRKVHVMPQLRGTGRGPRRATIASFCTR
jgi:hypothetical protein